MSRILVPLDGNPSSEDALEYALGEFPDAEITVLHVIGVLDSADYGSVPDDLKSHYEHLEAEKERLFETAERRASEAGIELETATEFGPPSREIPQYAAAFDRIVMGEHGQTGARQILLGSVAETVVRRSPVPVTVVRTRADEAGAERPSRRDRRFLVPIDGSATAEYALEYALSEHRPDAITVLYVIDPTDPEYGTNGEEDRDRLQPPGSEAWYERAEGVAENALESARERASSESNEVDLETRVEIGDPVRVITEYAEAGDFDHVSLGSRGRTGLDRLLLGSVAERVVRRSPITVTVVRK